MPARRTTVGFRAELDDEVAAGRVKFNGSPRLVRSFPNWFVDDPMLAEVRRTAREERLDATTRA